MRRLVALALLVFVPVLLAGPWLIGRQSVDYSEQALAALSQQQSAVTVVTEEAAGGWFRGFLRHRLILDQNSLADPWRRYFKSAVFGDQPAFLVETLLDNGPVAFSSLHRPGGSLAPALQRAVSKIWLDRGQEQMTPLPFVIYSTIGITGGLQIELDSNEGVVDVDGLSQRLKWQALNANASSTRDGEAQEFRAVASELALEQDAFSLKGTELLLTAATQNGRWQRASFEAQEVQFSEPALPAPELYKNLSVSVSLETADDKAATKLTTRLGNYPLADGNTIPVALALTFKDLDGLEMASLPDSQDAFFSWLQSLPRGETQLIEIDSLRVGDDAEAATASGKLELDARCLRRGDMEQTLARSSGSLAIRMPIVTARKLLVGDLAVLSAYMRIKGNVFEADLTLEQGKLSLNGTELFQF